MRTLSYVVMMMMILRSSTEPVSITYANPSSFFVTIDFQTRQDFQNSSNNLNNYFDDDLFIGMHFESKEATVNAIKQFHIKNSVDYTIVESKPDRYTSINVKRNLWEIRKNSGRYTCVSTCIFQDHTKLSSSFIASCIVQLVSEDRDIPIKTLVKEVVTRFGYTGLPRWLNVVECNLSGTIVRYTSFRHEDDMDETFLTGKYCGTLLIATSKDGNRRVFPIAFAIVEGETKEVWKWFFYNLWTYVTPQPNICVILDRGTCLLGALRTELPQWCNAQSVYCIRHVASNFNKEFKDTYLKEKVVEMGYELVRPRFERMLSALRQKNPRAAAWLDNILKEKWTQSYDDGR
ncbi:hypothetical protein Lal_00038594 [Lupinus albus]|nr:hypothetical protein Lal_00038594 [Lupinus albus]